MSGWAQHFALISLLFAGIGVGSILKAYGHDRSASISSHAGRQRASYWLFVASLLLSVGSFSLFAFLWLLPTKEVSGFGMTLMMSAFILLLATALIPDSGGRKSMWHGIVAWSMAVSLLSVVLVLLVELELSAMAYAATFLAALYMVIDWFIFLFIKQSRKHFLIFQASYIIAFFVAILAIAYL